MRAIARLCWTYGTALPLQRWLGGIALAIWALALLMFVLSGRPAYVLALVATGTLGAAMYILATTMLTGFLCQALSVPRPHRFLPHFRPRMVAAFLLVIVAVSSPALALLVWPTRPDGGTAGALTLLFAINIAALLAFSPRGVASVVACLLLLANFVAIVGRPSGGTAPQADLSGASAQIAAVGVWVAWWAAFAVWYLRARSFRRWPPPSLLLAAGRLDVLLPSDTTGEFSRSSALATSLNARYPLRAKHLLMRLGYLLAVVAAASILLRRFGTATPIVFGYAAVALFLPICTIGPIANQLARRTRLLWLTSGLSRRALFAAMEHAVWRNKVPWSFATFACISTAAAFGYGWPPGTFGRVVALWGSGTVLSVYLGLAVRRALALEFAIAVGLLTSVGVGAWAALAAPPRDDWLVGVAALQLAAAAAFRAFALARWERLDWLAFRPARLPSQRVRGGG